MGEVYRGEAHVLACVNHHNIAAIYGLEESAGTTAIVLELITGRTLADRISAGPIPVDEALPIASQISISSKTGSPSPSNVCRSLPC